MRTCETSSGRDLDQDQHGARHFRPMPSEHLGNNPLINTQQCNAGAQCQNMKAAPVQLRQRQEGETHDEHVNALLRCEQHWTAKLGVTLPVAHALTGKNAHRRRDKKRGMNSNWDWARSTHSKIAHLPPNEREMLCNARATMRNIERKQDLGQVSKGHATML